MPRLTNVEYQQHHLALRREWLSGAYAFVVLEPDEQIALHNFYEPSLDLTVAELRELRARVTREQPSLPQRAGKAYQRIAVFLDGQAPVPVPVPRAARAKTSATFKRGKQTRVLRVFSLVQPQIDPAAIARALVIAALDDASAEQRQAREDAIFAEQDLTQQPEDEDQAA